MPIPRVENDETADSLPEREQRVVVALVLRPDERASELERRREAFDEPLVKPEQTPRVQPGHSGPRNDAVGLADPVGADHASLTTIPYKEVQIMLVERIDICGAPGAFAN